jgi:hypothetical protein
MASHIKLFRELASKSFYAKDSQKVHLWIHLLISANWIEKEEILGGKPYLCKPGEFTTGRKQLSKETGISESKIERLLTYFEKTEQQIEQQKTSTNRLISICNWCKYQTNGQQIEQRVNNDRTTSEQRVNTPKEYKEREEYIYSKFYDKEIEKAKQNDNADYPKFVNWLFVSNLNKRPFAKVLNLKDQITVEMFEKYLKEYGADKLKETIISMDNYTKKTYSSFNSTLNNWLKPKERK